MEPKLPMPRSSPEAGGYQPEVPQPIEVAPSQERQEKLPDRERIEVLPQQPPAEPIAPAAAPSTVTPQLPPTTDDSQVDQPVDDTNPISASDDDLIERVWIDKAKRIVRETKSDPYKQEDEVSKLQADYLKKRYGKDIKLSK